MVYGKSCLLSAVERRVRVSLQTSEIQNSKFPHASLRASKTQNQNLNFKSLLEIKDKNLGISEKTNIDQILKFTKLAKKKWEEFRKNDDILTLKNITADPLALIKIAIGECLLNEEIASSIGKADLLAMTDDILKFEIESEIPNGRGMGSSAALATVVVGAVYALLRRDTQQCVSTNNDDLKLIYKIALEAEKRIHGNPSGADIAAATYGGIIKYKKGEAEIEKIEIDKELLKKFVLLDTGKPEENTGEMVAGVRKRFLARKRWGKEIIMNMETRTKNFLKGIKERDEKVIKENIFAYETCLEKIGVVSEGTKEIIRKLKGFGIAAKVSGAGGRKGASGMVLAYGDIKKIKDLAWRMGVEAVPVEFGAEGIMIEKTIQ